MKWIIVTLVLMLAGCASPQPKLCDGVLVQVGVAKTSKEYDDKIILKLKPVFACVNPNDLVKPAPKPKKKGISA
jgi:hypothetical protein